MQRQSLGSSAATSACTVLVVDTDVKVVHGFAQALRKAGFIVFEATSFEDGKRLWFEIRPEALIVDVRLGQFNGLQLLMRARSERPDLKAIITCPFADPVLEAEARRFGGTFMIKPLAPWQIVGALQTATASQSAVPLTPPLLVERRRSDRRKQDAPIPWPERRLADRRATAQLSLADQKSVERRKTDRRQVEVPDFTPNRRIADRRRLDL